LVDNVFPALKTLLEQDPESFLILPAPLEDVEPPEPPVDGEPVDDTQPNKKIVIPMQLPGPTRRRGNRILSLILSCLILGAFGGVAFYFYRMGLANAPKPPVIQVVVTATPLALSPTIPVPTPAQDTPSPAIAPTEVPASPTIPPATQTLTPTFEIPADGILFEDNFENNYKADWQVISGDWITSDKRLTVLSNTSGKYIWIGLNHPEWKNYVLSVNINIPFQFSAAQSDVVVAVRTNISSSKYIGVALIAFDQVYLAFIGSSHSDTLPIAGQNKGSNFASGSTLEVQVKDDTFTLKVDGREIQSITLQGYESGGINLGIECGYDLGCPSFDDVKVTYLP